MGIVFYHLGITLLLLAVWLYLSWFLKKWERETSPVTYDTFTDPRDGNVYLTVKIGNQVWMAENLRCNIENSWCYDEDEANCQKYGRLYTWDAATKACPAGWHLPTREEWRELVRAVDPNAQLDINNWDNANVSGKKLKSNNGWNGNGNGTDEYVFSALPGGDRYTAYGSFGYAGYIGNWWTSTEYGSDIAYYRYIIYDKGFVSEYRCDKSYAFSVRCVKD
jgi:uncharacterized protein (TIGR02145 family)